MSPAPKPLRPAAGVPVRTPATLALAASLWIAGIDNWPLWRALWALPELHTPRGMLFIAGFGLMIAALLMAVLSLLAWRRSLKPAIAVLLVAAALGAHFMGSYGIVIDPTMMVNVFGTDVHETLDLLDLRLALTLLVLAGAPLVLLWRAKLPQPLPAGQALRNLTAAVLSLTVMISLGVLFYAELSSTMRNHKSLRYLVNPANAVYALGHTVMAAQAKPPGAPQPIGLDVRLAPRHAGQPPPMLMLVLGETARADHFGANGYARATDAQTAALGLISFRDVSSCGTNTAASLPCMLSPLGREAFVAREGEQENLVDLLHRAGLAVLWIENQAGCKGQCERVPHAHAKDAPAGTRHPEGLCDGDECLDEALLTGLDERLAALPAERRARGVVLVLHQMGSHGPAYHKRSPAARKAWNPECRDSALQACASDALVNAYDNSIAYTDHVLARAVGWLQRQQAHHATSLLYVSDHGESLGEKGLYLHGLPYAVAPREQTHVPMLLWLPPTTEAAAGVRADCVRAQRDRPLAHDRLFHTVLGLVGASSREYRPSLDLLAGCRAA